MFGPNPSFTISDPWQWWQWVLLTLGLGLGLGLGCWGCLSSSREPPGGRLADPQPLSDPTSSREPPGGRPADQEFPNAFPNASPANEDIRSNQAKKRREELIESSLEFHQIGALKTKQFQRWIRRFDCKTNQRISRWKRSKDSNERSTDSNSVRYYWKLLFEKGSSKDCCSICLEPYQFGDTVARLKKKANGRRSCKHWFHKNCIHEWLENHDECPLCRVKIVKS